MTKQKNKAQEKSTKEYVCKACRMRYPTKTMKDACEAWCNEHHSCNMDIIKDAIGKG
ncbi:hypothetical protein HYV84_03445 [Candidatus Woesearchaeota archaeon]|nr:hypothetical protein [Candidatus Woesearchaeota archaeon]